MRLRVPTRTWVRALLVLALLAAVAMMVRERPVDARAAAVDRGPVRAEASGTGTLEPDASVSVAFTTAGRIATIQVREGDRVRKGDLLATLDVQDAAKQLAVARANEGLAASAIARSKAELARAKASHGAALLDHDRTGALVSTGAAPVAQLDGVDEKLARTAADVDGATAAIGNAHAGLVVAKQTVALHAHRITEGRITSPIDGVVVARLHEPGDVVGVGATVLVVATTERLLVRAWIDETALASLGPGGDARVVLRSEPGTELRGRIDKIALEADRQTHEVLVDVEVLDRPARFAFGQRADVFLTLEERRDVVRVPAGFCDAAAARCLVERDGRAAAIAVTFGLQGAEHVEVVHGLAAGDVVLRPTAVDAPITPGRRVRRSTP